MRRQGICVRRIIDSGHKVRVRIARIGGYFLTLVADCMHIMAVIIIGVVDMAAAGMRDRQNLTNASGRRRSASIGRGMQIRVLD